ncbi:MAG: hypothetical protein J6A33_06875 [Alphaproteobacteria bacterium]|nr:hypothetical protein [Alphaproteobacteria bacterium]
MTEVFLCSVLAAIVFCIYRYYGTSAKYNNIKAHKACREFEKTIGNEMLLKDLDSDMILKVLKRYSVRKRTMLRFGIVLNVYETQGSDGIMSVREEALLDKVHNRYRQLYELVDQSLPAKLRREYYNLKLRREA